MNPTRVRSLVALLVAVAAVAWGALTVTADRGASLPPLTWTAPAGVAGLAVVILVVAFALRARLARPDKRPHPLSMARMAVLGKASAHVGPIVCGLYTGYLIYLLPTLDIDARRDRALLCTVAGLFAVGLTVAGLLLERTCRVRGSDDEPPPAPAA